MNIQTNLFYLPTPVINTNPQSGQPLCNSVTHMSEVFSRIRIAASARQAVIDAQKGQAVSNPHIEGSDAAAVWDVAFERYSAELDGCEACA